jgi:hypothetical protein
MIINVFILTSCIMLWHCLRANYIYWYTRIFRGESLETIEYYARIQLKQTLYRNTRRREEKRSKRIEDHHLTY